MTDAFLESMTFLKAGEFLDKCDCEECANIPPSIQEFIDLAKHKRRTTGPIKRTQQRSLLGRDGQISLWCMNMPKNAEPLVEFGSSHRIVWIRRLANNPDASDTSTLRWIGNGIIGSSDEEKSRKKMTEWTEGSFFLVPSNGGKAIGWIHTNVDSAPINDIIEDGDAKDTTLTQEKNSASYSIAVLLVAKIPLHVVNKEQGKGGGSNRNWTNRLIECCRNGLECYKKQPGKTPSYYKFSAETSKLLKKAFLEAEGVEAKDDAIEPANKRIRLDEQVTRCALDFRF